MARESRNMKRFKAMTKQQRFEYMATADRVTVGCIEQVDEDTRTFVRSYVAKVRGIIVSDGDTYKFPTQEAARAFGRSILAGWKRDFAQQQHELGKIKPPLQGYKRQWVRCKKCGRIAYYDYVPYSLSNPVMIMPCGHTPAMRFRESVDFITEDEALAKFLLSDDLPKKEVQETEEKDTVTETETVPVTA